MKTNTEETIIIKKINETKSDLNPEKETERLKEIFEMISDEFDRQRDNKKDMDDRASKSILFVGILVGLLSSFGSLLLKDISNISIFYELYKYSFLASIILLVVSIFAAILAYKIRYYTSAPYPGDLIIDIRAKKQLNKILKDVSDAKYNAFEENRKRIKSTRILITISYLFFSGGLFTLLIFIISLFTTNPIFINNI